MSFFRYLDERRYVIALLAAVLTLVAVTMAASPDGRYDAGDIGYIMFGSALLTAVYLAVGYARWKSRCRLLSDLLASDSPDLFAAMPKQETYEQQLHAALMKKLQEGQLAEIRNLQQEKRDYHDFIMSWIHEVKIPITACYMLIKNSSGKSAEELAGKIEDEIDKIDHYVEQSLYYARIDSFSQDYLIADISLNQLIRDSVKKHAKMFIHKQIRISMWDEQARVHSDGKWLGYIVDQIITNALKYTHAGGSIDFSFETNKEEKKLVVRDSGIGIKAEDIRRVFERGFTGANGRNHPRSTGMGLYLADQMARKLGHRISVRAEEGRFTEVAIHFPRTAELLPPGSMVY